MNATHHKGVSPLMQAGISIRDVGPDTPFRLYGGSLLSDKSNQNPRPNIRPSAALRVLSLRQCSRRGRAEGPSWPSALARHPCLAPDYALPAFDLLKGQFGGACEVSVWKSIGAKVGALMDSVDFLRGLCLSVRAVAGAAGCPFSRLSGAVA